MTTTYPDVVSATQCRRLSVPKCSLAGYHPRSTTSSNPPTPSDMADQEALEPPYTVIIRVPFPRGHFVDPAPVIWTPTKDRSLWKTLLKIPKHSAFDWNVLAEKYDVPLTFLLQQAAYLYDQQFEQVRAHLRRVGSSKSSTALPMCPDSGGIVNTARTPSGQGQQSALNPADLSIKGAASRTGAPPMSRNSSAKDAAQLQSRYMPRISPRPAKAELHAPSSPIKAAMMSDAPSSSTESESEDSPPGHAAQSRAANRGKQPQRPSSSDEGDVDSSFTYLGFNEGPATPNTPRKQASAATLREPAAQAASRRQISDEKKQAVLRSQTSDSSASSTAHHPVSHRDHRAARVVSPGNGADPVSKRTAELAGQSSQSMGKGRESDGTPSMGSSFSDLDDASVTQSALEEALLSNMQHGGMASKMTTFSQAFRSRYL